TVADGREADGVAVVLEKDNVATELPWLATRARRVAVTVAVVVGDEAEVAEERDVARRGIDPVQLSIGTADDEDLLVWIHGADRRERGPEEPHLVPGGQAFPFAEALHRGSANRHVRKHHARTDAVDLPCAVYGDVRHRRVLARGRPLVDAVEVADLLDPE